MGAIAKPKVQCDMHHPILAVADVKAAAAHYADTLGFVVAFTEGDRFAGVNLDCVQIFLMKGEPAPPGCGVYFVVGDADELYAYHSSRGADIRVVPGDRDYGLRDYTARDLDGYALTFGHRLARGDE